MIKRFKALCLHLPLQTLENYAKTTVIHTYFHDLFHFFRPRKKVL